MAKNNDLASEWVDTPLKSGVEGNAYLNVIGANLKNAKILKLCDTAENFGRGYLLASDFEGETPLLASYFYSMIYFACFHKTLK